MGSNPGKPLFFQLGLSVPVTAIGFGPLCVAPFRALVKKVLTESFVSSPLG